MRLVITVLAIAPHHPRQKNINRNKHGAGYPERNFNGGINRLPVRGNGGEPPRTEQVEENRNDNQPQYNQRYNHVASLWRWACRIPVYRLPRGILTGIIFIVGPSPPESNAQAHWPAFNSRLLLFLPSMRLVSATSASISVFRLRRVESANLSLNQLQFTIDENHRLHRVFVQISYKADKKVQCFIPLISKRP